MKKSITTIFNIYFLYLFRAIEFRSQESESKRVDLITDIEGAIGLSGNLIPNPAQAAAKAAAEQKKKMMQFPALALKKFQEYLKQALSRKDTSLKDYIPVGNYYFSKKLLFMAALFIIAAIPVIIKLLPPDPAKTPTLRQGSSRALDFTGKAKLLNKDGSLIYEGEFAAGAFQGDGKQFSSGKLLFQGNFDGGMRTGPGKEFYPNGTVKYQGEFQNNRYSGVGSLFASNGAQIFSGNFQNGLYYGAGKLLDAQGNLIYEGQFVNGKREGLGTLLDPKEGTVFKGYFADDAPYYEGFLGMSAKRLQEILGPIPQETSSDPDQPPDEDQVPDTRRNEPFGRNTLAETLDYNPGVSEFMTYDDYAVTFIFAPSPLSAQKKHVDAIRLWGFQQAGMIDLTKKTAQIKQIWGKPFVDKAVAGGYLRVMIYLRNRFVYRFYYSQNGIVLFLEIQ